MHRRESGIVALFSLTSRELPSSVGVRPAREAHEVALAMLSGRGGRQSLRVSASPLLVVGHDSAGRGPQRGGAPPEQDEDRCSVVSGRRGSLRRAPFV